MFKLNILFLSSLLCVSTSFGMEQVQASILAKDPMRKLVKAIERRNLGKCKKIVKKYPDVVNAEHITFFGDICAPLHLAVEKNSVPIARFLLASGAACNALTKSDKYTPLHMVRSKEMAKMLIKYGGCLTNRDSDYKMPLYNVFFCSKDYNYSCPYPNNEQRCDIAHYLLKKGAEINQIVDWRGNSLLHTAVRFQSYLTVQFLLERNANTEIKNDEGRTPLEIGIINYDHNRDAVGKFRMRGILFSSSNDENNHFQLLENGAQFFKALISLGELKRETIKAENSLARLFIDISNSRTDRRIQGENVVVVYYNGRCFNNATFADLEEWVGHDSIKYVRRHCEKRCQEASLAVHYGDTQKLKLIVADYPYVLTYDKAIAFDLLDYVIRFAEPHYLGWFLDWYFYETIDKARDLRNVDKGGNTLFHKAIFHKNAEAIKLFIGHESSLTMCNHNQQTPFSLVHEIGDKACIDAFDNAFIDKLFSTYSYQPFYQEIKKLLRAGFKVNMIDAQGKTLLQRAVEAHPEKCSLLLKNGAVVTQEIIQSASSPVLRDMLQKKYEQQDFEIISG